MQNLLQLSSLEKVLPVRKLTLPEIREITVLKGERFSYQIAYKTEYASYLSFKIDAQSCNHITVYRVNCVPMTTPTTPEGLEDSNYITHDGGVMPDCLVPVTLPVITSASCYSALWFEVDGTLSAGTHTITVTFKKSDDSGAPADSSDGQTLQMAVHVLNAELPQQKTFFTQWLHVDCIKTYYDVETFSEQHWVLIEKYLRMAHKYGINTILTPVFTPPLDTYIGGERPTVQLADVRLDNGVYTFDFEKMRRYIKLCLEIGFTNFEMSHLFTQWGAKFTPKIMVLENGEYKRRFGWDTAFDDERYVDFLNQFLPELVAELKKLNVAEQVFFHLSDEPGVCDLDIYKKAKEIVKQNIGGCKIMDALSHVDFYKQGLCDQPVVTVAAVESFIQKGYHDFWVYYCGEANGVSNRFLSMPLCRTRFIAYQMFKYHTKGFLHWGFNFYYSRNSRRALNPFFETDGDGGFVSGDPYSVYPGKDGPLPSLRLLTFYDALQDIRAMQLLESYIGHEAVVTLLESAFGEKIVYSHCAESSEMLIKMRSLINKEIQKHING